MWSCAAISSRDFGRLCTVSEGAISVLIWNGVTCYFSTHGCRRLSCVGAACFDELACAAAAACRALMSKKLAIVRLIPLLCSNRRWCGLHAHCTSTSHSERVDVTFEREAL